MDSIYVVCMLARSTLQLSDYSDMVVSALPTCLLAIVSGVARLQLMVGPC